MSDRDESRAVEPVARCLMGRLSLPKIYYDVNWPDEDGGRVGILLIDHTGKGDVHIVEVRQNADDALDAAPKLLGMPAHYRWIAFYSETFGETSYQRLMTAEALYPSKGMGRIGAIEVARLSQGELLAHVKLTAERFKGSYYDLADRFTERQPADMEVR